MGWHGRVMTWHGRVWHVMVGVLYCMAWHDRGMVLHVIA